MFNVNGDIIEYDGKPFAVIISNKPTGFRMDAVDKLNDFGQFTEKDAVLSMIDAATKEVWLPDSVAEWLRDKTNELYE